MEPSGASKQWVLYADDDADDRMLLTDTIEAVAPEYTVETVPDGFSAINRLHDRPDGLPCLLILDLNMPGMSGKEVIRRIKGDTVLDNVPIVVFTTSSNPADRQECAQYGVDMVTKPLNLQELEATARLLLSYCK